MESIRKWQLLICIRPVQDEVARLAGSPEVRSAFDRFRSRESQFALWQMEATRVAAPPFGEAARGAWLADRFRELGLTDVQVDEVGNVFGVRPGYGSRFVALSAHIDTVFPAATPLNIRQQGSRLYGPGVSDNGAGIAAMLAVVSVLGERANFACAAVCVHWQRRGRRRRRPARHAARFRDAALARRDCLQCDCRWRRSGHRGGRGPGQPPLRGDRARSGRALVERLRRAQSDYCALSCD